MQNTINVSFSVPEWIFWGVAAAVAVTVAMLVVVSLVALVSTTLAGGWLDGGEPWKDVRGYVMAFVVYGLPVGLLASYTWFVQGPFAGILIGIVFFCAIMFIYGRSFGSRRSF